MLLFTPFIDCQIYTQTKLWISLTYCDVVPSVHCCCFFHFRYMGLNGQPATLRTWRSVAEAPRQNQLENGFSDPAVTPDEPRSEPLPDTPSLLPADSNGLSKSILQRQQSLVILTGGMHAMALQSLSHTVKKLLQLCSHPGREV